MLSSFSTEGARATLDALDAGAVDYLPKRLSDLSDDHEEARRKLCTRIRNIGSRRTRPMPRAANRPTTKDRDSVTGRNIRNKIADISTYHLIMIGASTGGPPVVQEIIKNLPASHTVPIVVIQHMPESFTGPFAERLNEVSRLNVGLAKNGDILSERHVYIAPGGHQLTFANYNNGKLSLSVKRSGNEYNYKPCIDVTFKSAAMTLDGKIMAIVLTGMGSDGTDGVRDLKRNDATVIVQDKESSVVYGMPMMVVKAGLADLELDAGDIASLLAGQH
jgi:two-component system chemotaxis response regulator CheB